MQIISRPYRLEHEPGEKELRQPMNYSTCLGAAYANFIEYIPERVSLNDVSRSVLNEHREAIAMLDTIDGIKKENDTVAVSHRYGGWTSIGWEFNDDIKFRIHTNFGFGCSSYFDLVVMYKGISLTPYTNYIKYRYANFSQINRCTESYPLVESSWRLLMTDAVDFYNAVVHHKEGYVFKWITNHLEQMTRGLERLRMARTFCFERTGAVSGDELTMVKANKIANSLDFVDNIRILPVEVNPSAYVNRIEGVCRTYLPELDSLIANKEQEKKRLESELGTLRANGDYQLYAKLRGKYYYNRGWYSNKRAMYRFLLRLMHKTLPDYSFTAVKVRIAALKKVVDQVEKLQSQLNSVNHLLDNLINCRGVIQDYFTKESQKAA